MGMELTAAWPGGVAYQQCWGTSERGQRSSSIGHFGLLPLLWLVGTLHLQDGIFWVIPGLMTSRVAAVLTLP